MLVVRTYAHPHDEGYIQVDLVGDRGGKYTARCNVVNAARLGTSYQHTVLQISCYVKTGTKRRAPKGTAARAEALVVAAVSQHVGEPLVRWFRDAFYYIDGLGTFRIQRSVVQRKVAPFTFVDETDEHTRQRVVAVALAREHAI